MTPLCSGRFLELDDGQLLSWLLLASVAESLGNPPRARLERRGAIGHIALVLDALVHRFRDAARMAAGRVAAAVRTGTRPSPGPVIGGLLRDVARSRGELIAETMLLRQQLRNATPFAAGPRFIIRDNDDKFGADFERAAEAAGYQRAAQWGLHGCG